MQKRGFFRRHAKKIVIAIWMLIFPFIFVSLALRIPRIQRVLVKKASDFLSETLRTHVSLAAVDISLFGGIVLEKIYVEDLNKDTLLFVNKIEAVPRTLQISSSNIPIIRLKIKNLVFHLKEDSLGNNNLQFILDAFAGDTSRKDTSSGDFRLTCKHFLIDNANFSYSTYQPEKTPYQINFDNLDLSQIQARFHNLIIVNSDISAQIEHFAFRDKSGLNVEHFDNSSLALSSKGVFVKDLTLKTPRTDLRMDSLNLITESWKDYSDFLRKVEIQAAICDSSRFSFFDIGFFTPEFQHSSLKMTLSGLFEGTIADFKAQNFKIGYAKHTQLDFSCSLKNLPQTDSLEFDLDIKELATDIDDISSVPAPDDSTRTVITIPKELSGLGTIRYTGKISGKTSEFSSQGKLESDLGTISTDIQSNKNSKNDYNVSGLLKAVNLDIGKIIGNTVDFGQLTFNQKVNFTYTGSKKLKLKAEGLVDSVVLNKYKYRNIRLYANMNDMNFDTISVEINMPDIETKLSGSADLRNTQNKFNFLIDIPRANLDNLHFLEKDSLEEFSVSINMDIRGDSPDNITGNIDFQKPLVLKKKKKTFKMIDFNFNSSIVSYELGEPLKKITLSTDYFDFALEGKFRVDSVSAHIQRIIDKYRPSEKEKIKTAPEIISKNKPTETGIYDKLSLSLKLKKTKILTDFFMPDFEISELSELKASADFRTDSLLIDFTAGYVKTAGIALELPYFSARTENEGFKMSTGCSVFRFSDENHLSNIVLSTNTNPDSSLFRLTWDNDRKKENYKADLSGVVKLTQSGNKKNVVKITLNPAQWIIADSAWHSNQASVTIDSTSINVEKLSFSYNNQSIFFDGFISEYAGDMFFVDIGNFRLSNLKPLLGEDVALEGVLSGQTRVSKIYEKPLIFTNDSIKNLKVNDISLGNLYFNSTWDSQNSSIGFKIFALSGLAKKIKTLDLVGNFYPETDAVKAKLNLTDFRIQALKKYWEEYIKVSRDAQLWGGIDISGTAQQPKISGNLSLKRATFKILYTGVQYDVNDSLYFGITNEKIFIYKSKIFTDKNSGYGWLQGNIQHKQFDNIKLDFSLEASNLMLLNAPETDSSYVYGNVYASGNLLLKGPLEKLKAAATLKTEKNTKIFVPIEATGSLSENSSYITFAGAAGDNGEKAGKDYASPEGLNLDVSMEMTPGAELQIIMDEISGDIMKVKGYGDLRLNMNENDEISLYGSYSVTNGDYLFTMKNVFSKHFEIENGGTIKWTGDPYNADLSMRAVYTLKKVSVFNLTLDETLRDVKTKAGCALNLSGKLMNPDISFGIDLPQAPESVKQQLYSSDAENLNKQFLSLLVLGTFQPLPGLSQETVGGSPINTGEVLSNQVNHWLSQVTGNVDVGLNYQTGDEVTTDEFDVELSTRLWNDRLIINGNVGVGGNSKMNTGQQNSANNLAGDVEVELKLNKSGSLRMKAFNKSNSEFVYDKGPYTQGVGAFWRKEFDGFRVKKKARENVSLKPDSLNKK